MKGNKMSAILAILLMLTGIIAIIPLGRSQITLGVGSVSLISANIVYPLSSQPTAKQPNANVPYPPVTNLNFVTGVNGTTGTTFWVDVDAYEASWLSTFSVGFVYNPKLLTCLASVNGTCPLELPASEYLAEPPPVLSTGMVSASGGSATDSYSMNGTGAEFALDMWNAEFEITGSLAYQESVAGTPQLLMGLSYTNLTIGTSFIDVAGNSYTPPLMNATITYTLPPPHAPVASSTVNGIAPPSVPTTTTGTPVKYDATGSTPGWNGTGNVPITTYYWDLLWNSTWVTTTSPTLSIPFTTPGTYTLDLTVNAMLGNYNMNSTNLDAQTVLVVLPPTGCLITLYTQNWRYIDPNYILTNFVGDISGLVNGTQADSYRPGDLVQLFANATYNGAPVSNALVTFEVFDNNNNVVLIATATTNCYGVAEWDFRIPWPSTESLIVNNFTQGSWAPGESGSNFGTWTAYATWQLGSQYTEEPPFEKTQAAYITFTVGWGLSVSIEAIYPNPAMRGPATCGYGSDVVVKINVMNDYLEPVWGLATVTIYDNLLVPIYPPAEYQTSWPVGLSYHNMSSIGIPSYAFVGTGYVVANLLSAPPIGAGTAFCPTAIATIVINPYS
jgi:hypothetical protein